MSLDKSTSQNLWSSASCLLKGNEAAGREMTQREVIGALALVPDDQATEQVVPAVVPFDDPSARLKPSRWEGTGAGSTNDRRPYRLQTTVRERRPFVFCRDDGVRPPRYSESADSEAVG